MLELGMRARALKRWLWGLLVLGMALLATPGRVQGKAGAGAPPSAPTQVVAVHVPPFGVPATMSALGDELARGMYSALRDANIPARLGRGDESSALVGQLEELSQAQVRLQVSYHGHSVQLVGDLEHLDDLVYAAFNQLRPRLQAATAGDSRAGALGPPGPKDSSSSPPAVVASSALPPPPTVSTARSDPAAASPPKSGPALPEPDQDSARTAPVRLASVKTGPSTRTVKPSPASRRPTETPPAEPTPVTTARESAATSAPPSLPNPPTVTTEPTPEPPPRVAPLPGKNPSTPRPQLTPYTFDPRRPRVAVHVIGEPVARIPAGYAGLGPVGQQSLISYLQQRLRIPAVASRLMGLTGGLVALDQSVRVGARHTLMARLDALLLSPSPSSSPTGSGGFTGGTLSGRIHLVLLLDGKLLLDRSVMLPPTLVLPAESPAQAYARIIFAAMDSVAGELLARLAEAPGAPGGLTTSPAGNPPGPTRSP